MKKALLKPKVEAASIAQGGRIIAAEDANYDTYELESTICAECGSTVLLKARESKKVKPYWAHFPGLGLHCPARANPSLIRAQINKQREAEFKKQCLAIFKTKLKKIFLYVYSQKSKNAVLDKLGDKWFEQIEILAHFSFEKHFPEYPVRKWLKDVPDYMKNLSQTSEWADVFFEDLITHPGLIKQAQDLLEQKIDDRDDSFTQKVINTTFKPLEMSRHRNIIFEMLRYFTTPESTDVFMVWFNFGLMQLCDCYENLQGEDAHISYQFARSLFDGFGVARILVLYSLYNLGSIDWTTIFNLLRRGEEPLVYVTTISNLTVLQDYLDRIDSFTPIRIASQKGFGKSSI